MKFTAIVPIKLNSERLELKNLRKLGGKPLMCHILDTLNSIKKIEKIVVATSSGGIIDILKDEECWTDKMEWLERPKRLDKNNVTFNDIFGYIFQHVMNENIVFACTTSPFIKASSICWMMDVVDNGNNDSSFAAMRCKKFAHYDGKALNYDISNVPRTQDLKPVWIENSGLYVFKRSKFLKTGRRIADKSCMHIMDYREMVDIDTAEELEYARFLQGREE